MKYDVYFKKKESNEWLFTLQSEKWESICKKTDECLTNGFEVKISKKIRGGKMKKVRVITPRFMSGYQKGQIINFDYDDTMIYHSLIYDGFGGVYEEMKK